MIIKQHLSIRKDEEKDEELRGIALSPVHLSEPGKAPQKASDVQDWFTVTWNPSSIQNYISLLCMKKLGFELVTENLDYHPFITLTVALPAESLSPDPDPTGLMVFDHLDFVPSDELWLSDICLGAHFISQGLFVVNVGFDDASSVLFRIPPESGPLPFDKSPVG